MLPVCCRSVANVPKSGTLAALYALIAAFSTSDGTLAAPAGSRRGILFPGKLYLCDMKTFPRILLLCLSAVLLLLAGACHPTARRSTAALLDDVESYINDRPDSALAVLRGLDSTAVRGRALRARAALLHSMALDKCYIDLQTDSILAPAMAWYERYGSPDDKLKTQYYLGRIQYNAGEYQEAIVTYTRALQLTNKANSLKYIGFVNQGIADIYSNTFLQSEAFAYLDHAFTAFMQIPDTALAKRTLYKKALALNSQNQRDASDSLFYALLSAPNGLEPLIPKIKADFALQLLREGNENKAFPLFKESISEAGGLPSPNHWAAYAYLLAKDGQIDLSERMFTQLDRSYPSEKRIAYWHHLSEYYQGDYKAAFFSLRQAANFEDSLLRVQLQQFTLAAQKEYFMNESIVERQSAQQRKLLLLITLLILCLVCLLGYLLIKHINQRTQHERIRLLQTLDIVNKQLESTQRGNAEQEQQTLFWQAQYTCLFRDYFNTLGKICADYEEGKMKNTNSADRVILRRIDKVVHDFTGKEENHEEFEALLNKHLNNIMNDFRGDFTGLSSKDYYLASYLFAGIDLPTISVLMGMEVENLYTRKSRLKSTIAKSNSDNKTRYLAFFHR